ncbi:MAG TPA: response regulator, partial [Polyangiaceae bacterium]|jgi:two-component system response regulator RegA|nr:response regulator [Polyangiaceae bacterium]
MDALQKRRPSIVVLEWLLPDASGLDLLTMLKRVSPTTRSVVLTAHASIPAALAAIRAGAADYMTKPASAIEILSALGAADLEIRQAEPPADHSLTLQQARRAYILGVLDVCQSISKTARVLHLDRTSLRRMLSRFDLPAKPLSSRPVGTVRTVTHFAGAVRELSLSLAASDG